MSQLLCATALSISKRLKRGLLDELQAVTFSAFLAGWVVRAFGVSCDAEAGPCSMIAFIVLDKYSRRSSP